MIKLDQKQKNHFFGDFSLMKRLWLLICPMLLVSGIERWYGVAWETEILHCASKLIQQPCGYFTQKITLYKEECL